MGLRRLLKPKNPFKKKGKVAGGRTIGQIVTDAQDRALNQMYPNPPAGGVGNALGLDPNNPTPTPTTQRFGPGYGGMRGMGMKQTQGTGEVQVARISPTSGWRYDVNNG